MRKQRVVTRPHACVLTITVCGYFCLMTVSLAWSQKQPLTPIDHNPRLCLGFDPLSRKWGWNRLNPREAEATCPKGFAIFETDDPAKNRRAWFNCCPLPAADILLEYHQWSEQSCPQDSIVTGFREHFTSGKLQRRERRCTTINTSRYMLSQERPGVYWGIGSSIWDLFGAPRLQRSEIPPAIVASCGRRSLGEWDGDGCIGDPMGSLLVEEGVNSCGETRFRALVFQGRDGDPPRGALVTMFPDCRRVSDIFDPEAKCRV